MHQENISAAGSIIKYICKHLTIYLYNNEEEEVVLFRIHNLI